MESKIVYEHFSSIEKLLKTISGRQNNEAMSGQNQSQKVGAERTRFCGTESFEDAVSLMANGWDEKLADVKKKYEVATKQNASGNVSRIRPTSGVVGYAPLVPNAIRGLPNSMISSERVPQKVKCVSIYYASGVDAGWSQDSMIESGIAVLRIVNNLELKGYRVKLTLVAKSSEGGGERAILCVDMKDFRQQLDLKKLCFPLLHPSMLRRIAFRWLETVPSLTSKGFRGGYGSPFHRDYELGKRVLVENGFLGKDDYYVTAYVCKECGYDIGKIMSRIGMNIN